MAEERMSQKEIDDLMKMLKDDPLGIENTRQVIKGDEYICIYCHKRYRIVSDKNIPSIKLSKNNGCKCYIYKISDIKKKYM